MEPGRQAALDAWRSCRRAAGVVGRPTCLPAGPVTYCSLFGPAPLSALSSHTPGWPALHACMRSSVWPRAGRPAGRPLLAVDHRRLPCGLLATVVQYLISACECEKFGDAMIV